MSDPSMATSVAGWPRLLLRLEGAALLALATLLYARTGASWWLYVVLFLAPDLGMLGYLAGSRTGAWTYNFLHVTVWPVALGLAGLWTQSPLWVAIALIWAAHIGFDRLLGFGLKYEAGFGLTHLGRIGAAASGQ